jgi:histidinol-phosphate phosphatase family protein
MPATPCVFLDRDGIVNERPPDAERYVLNWESFRLLPDFPAVLRVIRDKGYPAILVSNQRGVGRGLMSEQVLREIHDRLRARLREDRLELLDVFYCPSDDDRHPDRKPQPGMLLKAARRHRLDLARSWMIGDTETDVEAGRRAGCRTIRVAPGRPPSRADHQVETLAELARFLERHLESI